MNIAVISDIHGNHLALKQVLEYLEEQNIDAYIILGDFSGEFPGVQETLNYIYDLRSKYPTYIIKGNKEEYLLTGLGNGHPEWDQYPSTVGMLRYNHSQMRDKDWDFIRSLEDHMTVKFEGMEELFLCHGSPRNIKEEIHPECAVNKEILASVNSHYVVCGHIHECVNSFEFGKRIYNPGSVGIPIAVGKNDYSFFMILRSCGKEWLAEQCTLKQDVEALIRDMHQRRLYELAPYWARGAESYLRGSKYHNALILERAMTLMAEECGSCTWPMVEEKYWKRAYEELNKLA